jgi:hypothetical protein
MQRCPISEFVNIPQCFRSRHMHTKCCASIKMGVCAFEVIDTLLHFVQYAMALHLGPVGAVPWQDPSKSGTDRCTHGVPQRDTQNTLESRCSSNNYSLHCCSLELFHHYLSLRHVSLSTAMKSLLAWLPFVQMGLSKSLADSTNTAPLEPSQGEQTTSKTTITPTHPDEATPNAGVTSLHSIAVEARQEG